MRVRIRGVRPSPCAQIKPVGRSGIEYEGSSHFQATASIAKIDIRSQSITFGRRSPMRQITRVGVDLAKRVIQVHSADSAGQCVTGRALARDKFLAWCA